MGGQVVLGVGERAGGCVGGPADGCAGPGAGGRASGRLRAAGGLRAAAERWGGGTAVRWRRDSTERKRWRGQGEADRDGVQGDPAAEGGGGGA